MFDRLEVGNLRSFSLEKLRSTTDYLTSIKRKDQRKKKPFKFRVPFLVPIIDQIFRYGQSALEFGVKTQLTEKKKNLRYAYKAVELLT